MYKTTTRFLVILSVLVLTLACSTREVKPLSNLELARQLLKEQRLNETPSSTELVKVHITQPSKAIIDRPLELAVEIVATDAIGPITLTYAADENFILPRKWKFMKQDSLSRTIDNVKVDKVYREIITVIPQREGRLEFQFYLLYQYQGQSLARQLTLPVLIGTSMPATNQQL